MKKTEGIDWRLLRRLFPFLKGYSGLIILALFLMLASSLISALHPYFIKLGIDRDVASGDLAGLQRTAITLLILLIGGLLFQVGFNYSVAFLGQRLLFDLRLTVFRHLLRLSNEYFDQNSVGTTLTHVTNDVEAIREFISEGIITVLGEMLKIGFILVFMLLINFKLALMTFITIPLFLLATMLFRTTIRTGYRSVRQANAEINTTLVESITGIREIIQFNAKGKSRRSFSEGNRNYLKAYLKVVHAYALYFPILEIVSNIGMIIILFYAHQVIGISLRVGEIFAFFFYINMFFRPLRELAEQFNMFQSAMAAAERIFRFLDRKPVIVNKPGARKIGPNFKGRIVFDHVTFAYSPGNPVIKDISFTIEPGERVALVGHTGSGKTTIINLLNRLYDVDSGTITLDGIDCRDYDLSALRGKISTIPQDPFIFTGTVADNISLHEPGISQENIIRAAEQVYAHDFISALPNQYRENVLEEGKRLSTGQRQLLSFARSLVRQAGIVVMDEATSNIDSETEKLIEAATQNLLADKTAIIIAHRLSTIRRVDRILVLHKGKLVEQGTHRELMKKGGVYTKLYRTQAFLQN